MRGPTVFLSVAASLGLASAAPAAITVFGNSNARSCYEAARAERTGPTHIRHCTRALEDRTLASNDRVATYVNRGILHVYNGDFESGIADYDRAIALDASEPDAYLNKALALLHNQNDLPQIISLLTTALEFGTREPALAYYGRGLAYELSGDIPSAYYDIQRAVETDPGWELPARELTRFRVVGGEDS
ncbi:tetratricopeptide repeat protein [Parasphingopyxis marina]|uniref:Tetratricopeptide repeat protein n=1 Tax=Parasphingopyxis marina TaxID=2761622 RepID=A0A842HXT7_9SPHN|nr:tetratricopeptide repeat protein [Parasphingopyxis marina]MBC2777685.1 tetratricopeptide repeat protein [Parasphingopyxis marina]